MAYTNPTVSDFKNYFTRDFPYGTNPDTSVTDTDIAKAQQMANIAINQGLWGDQGSYNIGYNYLTAHYLVMELRSSTQGVNGQFAFLESSKSVGSVSQSFAIPQRVLDNPDWSMLMKTNYGAQYLQLVLPQLCGNMFSVCGRTLP